jgi:cyclic beta-1,2-glucan synthetase
LNGLFSSKTSSAPSWADEEVIREELFSVERLEQHAESLAAAQSVSSQPERGRPLAKRVRDNDKSLLEAYRVIAAGIQEKRLITPAAEWLVDNYHIAEDQIREIRNDLPPSYYRQLPKLVEGPFKGYPRIFEIAWAFVAHTDSRFEAEMLRRFVLAYQRVQPLTIGELWALAITIRVVLVENLRRLGDLIVGSQRSRDAADDLADLLLVSPDRSPAANAAALRPYADSPLTRSFAVQLMQRLRDEDPATTPVLLWLDERLRSQGTNADDIVRVEHRRQGAANVTIRNIITSMNFSKASASSTRYCGRAATLLPWISRPAIAIAAHSNSLRAIRPIRKSKSPVRQSSMQSAPTMTHRMKRLSLTHAIGIRVII